MFPPLIILDVPSLIVQNGPTLDDPKSSTVVLDLPPSIVQSAPHSIIQDAPPLIAPNAPPLIVQHVPYLLVLENRRRSRVDLVGVKRRLPPSAAFKAPACASCAHRLFRFADSRNPGVCRGGRLGCAALHPALRHQARGDEARGGELYYHSLAAVPLVPLAGAAGGDVLAMPLFVQTAVRVDPMAYNISHHFLVVLRYLVFGTGMHFFVAGMLSFVFRFSQVPIAPISVLHAFNPCGRHPPRWVASGVAFGKPVVILASSAQSEHLTLFPHQGINVPQRLFFMHCLDA